VPRQRFDPYAVLGLSPTATPDEITHAYRAQVRAFHPDTRTTPESTLPPADEQLRRVFAAYALLRDPQRRARYDRQSCALQPRNPAPSHRPASTGGNDKHRGFGWYGAHPGLDVWVQNRAAI
jgi:curved DNA-binding protein CbpA